MEKRLGQRITDAVWDLAVERSYVSAALGTAHDTGEDDLVSYLADFLRVQVGARREGSRRNAAAMFHATSPNLGPRIEALSRLAAEDAAGDAGVLGFRRVVLHRDTPMTPEEAEAYLDAPSSRGSRRASLDAGRTEILEYQNRRLFHTLHVHPASPLDRLRKLADRLARSYPWQPAQAAAFVLEGLMPRATPFMLRLPQTGGDGRPRRVKVILEVDAWVPANDVLKAYRNVQRQVLPGHKRPVSRRSIDLVNFVLRNRPAKWPDLLLRWNNEHPTEPYADFRRMRTAFKRAENSLLRPRFRTYLGPGC